MGGKSSKPKKEVSSGGIINATDSLDRDGKGRLKKKSHIKRKLTKAFSRKSTKPTKEREDNTYASSLQTTMKRTNSADSLASNTVGSIANLKLNVTLSSLHSQSITPISSPRIVSPRAETLATPSTAPYLSTEYNNSQETGYGNKGRPQGVADGADANTILPPDENNTESKPKVRRATTTSSFLKYELGGRSVALPKRMSKAYVFHQQLASKELAERGAELQKIIEQEKPICDVFEDNPFKKEFCRLCKHPKSVHRDPYSDMMDELMEDYY